YYSYGTELLSSGKIEEAMGIYQQLAERWPEHWLSSHGMARGYSAKGDYDQALKLEQDALTKAPENNKGFIESA
ncbi:MAG: tetratricopeptide repeat protein, partial [Aliifodinibius sp.]|nr:tetratricopeptide repeat protein [Fodinibius sp.]NIV15240.1 tetratricopeptide repeat protein [Fodinibius sp.]NIY29111.1 tetratricopeptide repeat protein [Fodinibius sp.]